ncbi:P1 family peptidase [Azospirillum thermophilum]|uniref:Peptidase T4 n=1 Tax=Azospirillum thermophilum TaxID=2202148 RepID=A0A2S2CTN3_9PROT|nr:P1 family peptidase [Azospirillum thermophilum]AWK87861.1 peptidase T4 [Azospirillum thermophilum]
MAVRPGPRNLITDVDGILVGNAQDQTVRSGVTVVLPDRPAVAAVDVRGGAPGTRETDALNPTCLVEQVDAVVLTGGSAFGLDAAAGAMGWLAARGRGFPVGDRRVPIVPAAVLFDLLNGGDKEWGETPPYRALAAAACDAAGPAFALGNAGAGLGAKAGDIKGGLGSASAVMPDGLQVGALIAVNPVGSAVMPGRDTLWAWAWEQDGEMGGQTPPAGPVPLDPVLPFLDAAVPGANTTIGVVATNAVLTKAEALRLATMAHDGMGRAIRPAHTPFDGDTLFGLATGTQALPDGPARAVALARLGALAADCVARAIGRGVYEAESLGPWPSYRARYRAG